METSHENELLIARFYTAFAAKDFTTMANCYCNDVEFEDPVFGKLKGTEAPKMWEMLLTRSKDLTLTFSDIVATDKSGSATWIARYTFSATGRLVVNSIQASFQFKDGKIINHKDVFDLNKWFKMAFGIKGYLFILLPFFRSSFRKKVRNALHTFMARQ